MTCYQKTFAFFSSIPAKSLPRQRLPFSVSLTGRVGGRHATEPRFELPVARAGERSEFFEARERISPRGDEGEMERKMKRKMKKRKEKKKKEKE